MDTNQSIVLTLSGLLVVLVLLGFVLAWLWVLAAGAALLARRAVRALRDGGRTDRMERGLCVRCGYDLRATPDGGALFDRCPECGSVTAGQPTPGRLAST